TVSVLGAVALVTSETESGGVGRMVIRAITDDGDPRTSEGLDVFVRQSDAPALVPGDVVRLTGTVTELPRSQRRQRDLTITHLIAERLEVVKRQGEPPAPVVIGAGGRTPPTEIADDDGLRQFQPATDGIDFWESLESTVVTIRDASVVGPTVLFGSGGTGNREVYLVADGGAGATGLTPSGALARTASDVNPEVIVVNNRLHELAGADLGAYALGERFDGEITGVVDYGYGKYQVWYTEPLPPASFPADAAAGASVAAVERTDDDREILVATYNLLNLFPRETGRIGSIARQIAGPLGSPELIGVQEIQDDSGYANDGRTSGLGTFAALSAAISQAGGPRYAFAQIDPENNADGGAPGGNIRVGLLFDSERFALARPERGVGGAREAAVVLGGPSLSANPARIDPVSEAFSDSRKPIVVHLTDRTTGGSVFAIVCHFNSKSGDDPLFGSVQPPTEPSRVQREAQASAVAAFVAEILAADPSADIVLLGDLNDFPGSPPLAILESEARLVGAVEADAALWAHRAPNTDERAGQGRLSCATGSDDA
ncbi:MAG: hypothetical protein AAFU70_05250, partial [Planctomycetota bacterium]